jgi:hypothetical protein
MTSGCGALEGIPLETTFRDSFVGAGKIVQLENTSNAPLADIAVEITAPSGESRSYLLSELGPYQTFEIGWKKLGGWQIPLGSEVIVTAKGYWLPLRVQLPGEEENG